jgi:Predicted permeases
MTPLVMGAISFVVGALIGCVGAGGVLIIPALEYIFGLDTHMAMGTALFSFIFTGSLGTVLYTRKKSMDWRLTVPLCLGSVITAYIGALSSAYLSARLLNVLLASMIIFSGVCSLRNRVPVFCENSGLKVPGGFFRVLAIGAGVGLICGMTGAGGPILSVPVMIVFGFPALPTIAASQVLQITLSSAGSVGNIMNGTINFGIVWWITALEMSGVAFGVWVAHKVNSATLKKTVAVVCILVGSYILVSALS